MSRKQTAKWDRTKGRPEPIRLLNRVKEVENHEPLVDIREHCRGIPLLRPHVIPFLRLEVANKLNLAQSNLPKGYKLGVVDAWRPIERQKKLYEFIWNCAREVFPERPLPALRRTVCRWVAPVDQTAPPGHCTGGAIDVWLLDTDENVIDVCAPYDRFGAGPTYSFGLTPEATKHRQILVDAMLTAGFSNCRDEWWHYSYGDAGWAVRLALDECIYGLSELPLEIYSEQERLSDEAFKTRPNPFLDPL